MGMTSPIMYSFINSEFLWSVLASVCEPRLTLPPLTQPGAETIPKSELLSSAR